MGQNYTPLIPTATEKQPKPKNQTVPQPKDGMGKIQCNPSPQRIKKRGVPTDSRLPHFNLS